MKQIIVFLLAALIILTFSVPLSLADEQITFWTTEKEKDRMEVQNRIAQAFKARTGISVKIIPVEENLLKEKVTAAYAAKSLPDVIFHPIDFTVGWAEEGVLDVKSATDVINRLGRKTFNQRPLELVQAREGFAAVPVDGWGQLLLYRADLFKEKNLPEPDTWDNILKAAEALHDPPRMWGFDAATDPGQTYTQQVFEHFALSNGVRLIGPGGQVALNTPEMVETLKFYQALTKFGPPGNLYWLHTRMDYLSDRTAMTVWSPYILDELSGLRQDQPVVVDIARGEPGFLARNTGFVTVIKGPKGAKAQYGQISYLGISVDADKKSAQKWIEYLLTDGYIDWMSMAPEGKMPMRKGTADSPTRFMDGWRGLEFGATSRARIADFYGADTVKSILAGVEGFDRWGFAAGQGSLVSKIYGTKIIPKILKTYLDGEITAEQAARQMDERVRALK